ncbi:type II secretion system protein GspL [Pseudomonas brenneri]|uniref:General secretion pathway protein GspL n=2 Tax=Pseudomonas brenneri TaxID=129817 RepID=A0A5B2UH53_9PSED|nr:hypothetical protein [Pseudomonas brenneri]KAA2226164.1 hypothetical protein F1720_27640 [Pseudomonas brenneri]TWR71612.1 hypothetical protein FJD34_27880 [Pseudomonas brenneri]
MMRWPLIDSFADRLWRHWNNTPLSTFFMWWRTELLSCVPLWLRARVGAQQLPEVLHWPLQESLHFEVNRPVVILLPADQGLLCHVQMPLQVARNLKSVLAFELDKYTPFTAEQIYFDTLVISPETHEMLQVSLVVIARSRVDEIVLQAQALGLQVAGVDMMDEGRRAQGINLLPAPHRANRVRRMMHITYGLTIGISLITLLILTTWLANREHVLEEMRQQVASLRSQAMEVDEIRKQLSTRTEMENTLDLQNRQKQTSVSFLKQLTVCIPPDTWLEQLETRADGSITFSGLSRHANALPAALISCAGLAKAVFQGGIQPDRESGLERFTIMAQHSNVER